MNDERLSNGMEEAGFPNLARANQIHPFSRKSQMVDVEVKSYKD